MGNAQTNILAQLLAELDSGGLKIVDLTSPLEPDTVVIDLPPIFAPSYQTGQRLNLRRPHQERCSAWRSMPPMQSFRNSAPAHYSPPALRAPVVPCWKLTARLAGFLPLGPDFAAQPTISPRYLTAQQDRDIAIRSIRLTRQIVAQPSFARFMPEEFKPGPSCQSDSDLERAAGEIGTTIFHPVGTCRMGGDRESVVDPRLRFRALRKLRIADASVMPSITSGNTNSPTIMIAEKAAAMILEDHR